MAAHHHFIYRGQDRDVIPRTATHVSIHKSIKVIPPRTFYEHPNIVEVICHDNMESIEEYAFCKCLSLLRVRLLGAKDVKHNVFDGCLNLMYVECDNVERIWGCAFRNCQSLSSMDMPSAKTIDRTVFDFCKEMAHVKFGNNLEQLRQQSFNNCISLERVTVPLKDGVVTAHNTFMECLKLKHADLLEEDVLRETISALLLDGWKVYMNSLVDLITWELPNAPDCGNHFYDRRHKAQVIFNWSTWVLRKIIFYKSKHHGLLNEAATALAHSLPIDIVMNSVIPFLELPRHSFGGNDTEEGIYDINNEDHTGESKDGDDEVEDNFLEGRKRRKTENQE